MSDHYVEWDGEHERLTITCEAPLDALCHAVPVSPCDCESWVNIRRDADGTWLHDVPREYDDEPVVTHRSEQDPTHCNPILYIEDSDVDTSGPNDLWLYDDDDEPMPSWRHPVDIEWDDYTYRWTFTEEPA